MTRGMTPIITQAKKKKGRTLEREVLVDGFNRGDKTVQLWYLIPVTCEEEQERES